MKKSIEMFKVLYCILTLDRTVNQRCTCVNKWKKKRKQVGVIKEYRQVPAVVELVGDWKARVRASLQTEGYGPQRPPVKQPQLRCGRRATMVKRSWVNIAVCPCLHSSLTHHRNIENKVWEMYIFIKKCVRSFIEVRKLCLIMFPLIFVYVLRYTTLGELWRLAVTSYSNSNNWNIWKSGEEWRPFRLVKIG